MIWIRPPASALRRCLPISELAAIRQRPTLFQTAFVGLVGSLILSVGLGRAQVLEVTRDGTAHMLPATAVYTDSGVSPFSTDAAEVLHVEASGDRILAAVRRAAEDVGLDPRILTAVARRESGLRAEARSRKGAVGVMQLTAAAAEDVGVDRFETAANIRGGATYLRRMLDTFGGDLTLALAAYNAGPGAVRRYGGIPPFAETQAYVAAILTALQSHAPDKETFR